MVVRKTRTAVARAGAQGGHATVWHPDLGSDFAPTFSADQHVGTALRETFRQFAHSVSTNVSGLGLSLNMWFVLRALWESDGLTQVHLAQKLEVTPAAIVGIVNALEKLGLVLRKRSKTDGRAYCIFLTPSGRSVRTKATTQALQVDARALRGFSIGEVETLLLLLKRLRVNLSE
jgi:DNA-binding MarR family transcriptional regulator